MATALATPAMGKHRRPQMLKTPVSILEELSNKNGWRVRYTLLYDGGTSSNPIFKYELRGFDKKSYGTGISKRNAKQEAAYLLLQKLNYEFPAGYKEPVFSAAAQNSRENAVLALLGYCREIGKVTPAYKMTKDSQCKAFAYKCSYLSFITNAEASTKRQAKQLAAHLMLKKLRQLRHQDGITLSELRQSKMAFHDYLSQLETTQAMGALQIKDGPQGKKIIEKPLASGQKRFKLHKFYQCESFPFSERLFKIQDEPLKFFLKIENPQMLFRQILQELDFQFNTVWSINIRKKYYIVTVTVPSCPVAIFVGVGQTEKGAERIAFRAGLRFFALMTSAGNQFSAGKLEKLTAQQTTGLIETSPFLK